MSELDLGRVVGYGVPKGGAVGQIPVKASATDYDTAWEYPQYSRQNLLDNWYFLNPVNQRGSTVWQNVGEYTVDRWKLTSGSASLGASGLTLNGTLTQTLETAIGQPVIGSALLSDGSMISPTYNDSTKTFSITATGQTIKAVKLELGSYQTLAHNEGTVESPSWVLNEIPDFGEELAKCQRYYLPLVATVRYPCSRFGSGTVDFIIPTPTSMTGKVNLEGAVQVIRGASYVDGFEYAILAVGPNAVAVRATKANHGFSFGDGIFLGVTQAATALVST